MRAPSPSENSALARWRGLSASAIHSLGIPNTSASESSSLRVGEASAIHRKSEGSAVARSYIAWTRETASGVSVPADLITWDCAASTSAPPQ